MSGARTNYRNSMCPASVYVTVRKNCCKPICPAPGKIGGSDCILNIICPASVDVTGIRLPQICPASRQTDKTDRQTEQ